MHLSQIAEIPLSLYIHMPWCVRKCPYCDFNSHELAAGQLSQDLEQQYIDALIVDFATQKEFIQGRELNSIFIGGGTPSLISAPTYQRLFDVLKSQIPFQENCEITMEANPGTVEHDPFEDYLNAGINRLSIGVQSFDEAHLKRLGRIHNPDNAKSAIQNAKSAGFQRINVDLMHGLPQQTVAQALADLQMAIDCGATHISWYQLTIEPNTVFYRSQPTLPDEEVLEQIQLQGEALLRAHGFVNYEVSAWAKERPSQHNLNYWQFGDYLAIGAGAHGKVTLPNGIYRFQKTRMPKDYLEQIPAQNLQFKAIDEDDMPFEFMMNALRLNAGVPSDFYLKRTGQELSTIQPVLDELRQKQLLDKDVERLQCTAQGRLFLNTVLQQFL
ncbi:MAG: radical SAM family heme chaperone HemW [Pseudomonadota bacterium]|nr:radical SAM family heme chaperone HemW [Pseudomonadota bacterium]